MSGSIRFARRVFLRTKPDKVDELLSTMREKVYPQLRRERGMRRAYLLRDTVNRNEFISLTLWESRGNADAYESAGHFAANSDMVRGFLVEDPAVSKFEVETHAVSRALPPPAASPSRGKGTNRAKRRTKRRKR